MPFVIEMDAILWRMQIWGVERRSRGPSYWGRCRWRGAGRAPHDQEVEICEARELLKEENRNEIVPGVTARVYNVVDKFCTGGGTRLISRSTGSNRRLDDH